MSKQEINLRAAKLQASRDSRANPDKYVYIYMDLDNHYMISVGKLKKFKLYHCFKNGNEISL